MLRQQLSSCEAVPNARVGTGQTCPSRRGALEAKSGWPRPQACGLFQTVETAAWCRPSHPGHGAAPRAAVWPAAGIGEPRPRGEGAGRLQLPRILALGGRAGRAAWGSPKARSSRGGDGASSRALRVPDGPPGPGHQPGLPDRPGALLGDRVRAAGTACGPCTETHRWRSQTPAASPFLTYSTSPPRCPSRTFSLTSAGKAVLSGAGDAEAGVRVAHRTEPPTLRKAGSRQEEGFGVQPGRWLSWAWPPISGAATAVSARLGGCSTCLETAQR